MKLPLPITRRDVGSLDLRFAKPFRIIYEALHEAARVYVEMQGGTEPEREYTSRPLHGTFKRRKGKRVFVPEPVPDAVMTQWEARQGHYTPGAVHLFERVARLNGKDEEGDGLALTSRAAFLPVQVPITAAFNSLHDLRLPRIAGLAASSAHDLAVKLVDKISGICLMAPGILTGEKQADLGHKWRAIHEYVSGSPPIDFSQIAEAMWREAVQASSVRAADTDPFRPGKWFRQFNISAAAMRQEKNRSGRVRVKKPGGVNLYSVRDARALWPHIPDEAT